MNLPLQFSDAVAEARGAGRPVVALESTIITHGMPAPRNVDVALAAEEDIRAGGAVPATIAVIDGRLRIGLAPTEIRGLAARDDVVKLSRADLAPCIATGGTGATTVAATMIAARAAGIDVFATGGIGGVHSGADRSFDISADLQELAQTAVTVVSAGAKAILDLPKTLEVLETLGVPVIAVGQDDLPGFWSRSAGLRAPLRCDMPETIAAAALARAALGLPGGQLVAVPVPGEAEIPAAELGALIDTALAEAETRGVTAKAVTPFLLARLTELTAGRTLEANIALVRNNARFAARLAAAFAAARAARGAAPGAPL